MSRVVVPTLELIQFQLVRINDDAIGRLADTLRAKEPRRTMYGEFDLHPRPSDTGCPNWIFLIDSLNFSFWHDDPADPFRVMLDDSSSSSHTGYGSLCAIVKRAVDEGYPMTRASFWRDLDDETWRHIARGVGSPIPLLDERRQILNDTGATLVAKFEGNFANLIAQADHDIYRMIELVLEHFPYFRDQTPDGTYKFMKRVQILIADLWSCFDGQGLGRFDNINEITMFADYRVPQSLLELGILEYSDDLLERLAPGRRINNRGENVVVFGREEVEIRAASILSVDRVRKRLGPSSPWNSILIDFYLWNYSKGIDRSKYPFHRVRTLFY